MSAALPAPAAPAVAPTGDRMVFLVVSETNPRNRYRVDLIANNGAGQCTCPDFRTRKQAAIDAGAESWTHRTSCKHSRRAARHVMRETFAAMAKSETETL
jgi:hypothetical protein